MHQSLDVGFPSDIHLQADPADAISHFAGLGAVNVGNHDSSRILRGKPLTQCPSNSVCPARNHHDLAGDLHEDLGSWQIR
jgi:hypothetical protein